MRDLLAAATAFLRMPAGERAAPASIRATAAIAAAVLATMGALSVTGPGTGLEQRGFDALTVATAPGKSQLPITIVGIDEASFAQIGLRWPWPRSLYAKLLDQLKRSGAMVVALDVTMSEASTEAEDRAFAEAIARSGNVVIASTMAYQETAFVRQWIRMDPIPAFVSAGATKGLAHVDLDRDGVVRRVPEGDDVFWKAVIARANAVSPGLLPEPQAPAGALIRYVGPDHTFPYVSFYQALDADTHLPPGAFQDQIVLVGRDIQASVDAGAAQADLFLTPFTASTRGLVPGVEIHANLLEGAVTKSHVVPVAPPWRLAVIAAATILASALLRRWRPLTGLAIALAIGAALAGSSWWLFANANTWLPVSLAIMAVALTYVAFGGIAFVAERRRRSELRRAFALYVSPDVVDQMLESPERLRLGGERRTVTVLFTDLAGFTTISEKHGPEQVVHILQQHFTRASAIVKRHRGTLLQFIGDALMAVWGAPLDDPQHAVNACQAAREMQADLEDLRASLAAEGLPPIHMRVGIHTTEAAVGNFGAEDRFNYTALGDGVNLASRLEGANKLFGTPILLSGATARLLPDGAPLRQLGRIVVKGKSEPVEVFTFDEDAGRREATSAALAAYARREWDAAEAAFRNLAAKDANDGVAAHYLGRIAVLRQEPPEPGWDGSEMLDKL
ncbi:MAG: adenylate/guanylate cyclase domain-containing protein [Betaproteobacteria bacterium]|nr:adenylate/guanylate cyclase domain-containing protein [Betaproteobacteria bacterium]